MSCEPLKKLPRNRASRPSSGFCCAEACVAKARTKTVAISTTRRSTAATNDKYATKKNEFTRAERSITTSPVRRRNRLTFGYRNVGFVFPSCHIGNAQSLHVRKKPIDRVPPGDLSAHEWTHSASSVYARPAALLPIWYGAVRSFVRAGDGKP